MQNTRRYFLKTCGTLLTGMLFMSFQKFQLKEIEKEEEAPEKPCSSRFCRYYKNGSCGNGVCVGAGS